MGFIYDWCEERFQIQSIADDILAKFVPAHVNIFYCFGGIVLTSFIFQGASGFALTIYYRPTVVEAFASVNFMLYHVNLGWFIRSIHRWSSGIMVMVTILHIYRVYLSGGFKKTKRINLGYRCNSSCNHFILWCYWIFITLGPNCLLGM